MFLGRLSHFLRGLAGGVSNTVKLKALKIWRKIGIYPYCTGTDTYDKDNVNYFPVSVYVCVFITFNINIMGR